MENLSRHILKAAALNKDLLLSPQKDFWDLYHFAQVKIISMKAPGPIKAH